MFSSHLMLSLEITVHFHAEKFKSAFHLPPATHLHWHNIALDFKSPASHCAIFHLKFLFSAARLFPIDTTRHILIQPQRSELWHRSPEEESQNGKLPSHLNTWASPFSFFQHIYPFCLRCICLWNMTQMCLSELICISQPELCFLFFSPSHTYHKQNMAAISDKSAQMKAVPFF